MKLFKEESQYFHLLLEGFYLCRGCHWLGISSMFSYKFYYFRLLSIHHLIIGEDPESPIANIFGVTSSDVKFICGKKSTLLPGNYYGVGHSNSIDWWALVIFLYEMLYAVHTFRGKNRQKTFANILHKDITFPSSIPVKICRLLTISFNWLGDVNMNLEVSLAGRQLLNLLLNRDPADRLGSNSGANEIKQHLFFRGINWPLIRTMSPPPLDAPPKLIEKDLKAKDVKWEDDGVLVNPIDLDLF
ncbi:hypothetical protein Pint_33756 [Pistacia integerrima]|uniref:Uncharacterized protein n=1 Tax=Pistacia integerrima TaxID=434235 RepID=A0ACC0X7V8_9ROSI|nr:hypothetical protein Pint_33756 [Pistacia integerrima]